MNRSLKRFPPGIKEEARPDLQDQLTRLIVRVLLKHPELHYYQGYHDVAITFLLVVGEEMGYHIMERLSTSHLREFMAPTMEKTTYLLNYMYPIVSRVRFPASERISFKKLFPSQINHCSPELHDFLDASEVGTIFALSWMITWFGHVLPDYEDVVRLYDFFLAQPPLLPVYLAAALVLHREQEVLLQECDLAMVHSLLSRIPVNLPFEKLLVDARELYEDFPPKSLETEVKKRYEKTLREQMERRRGVKQPPAANSTGSPLKTILSIAAITAPVIVGMIAYRYFYGAQDLV